MSRPKESPVEPSSMRSVKGFRTGSGRTAGAQGGGKLRRPRLLQRVVAWPCWPADGLTLMTVGVPGCTMNAVVKLTCCTPVSTVTERGPTAASGSMDRIAMAVVPSATVTGPKPPTGAPPTETPAPKLACVAPCETVRNAGLDEFAHLYMQRSLALAR